MTGYNAPNYTQIPNELLDDHLPNMKDAELRVVLSIARKTIGWHKQHDRISLTQLQKMTGMSRQGVLNGITDAVERGVVEKIEHEVGSYEYGLVVNEVDRPVNEVDQLVVNEVDTQKKVIKETNQKETGVHNHNVFAAYEDTIGTLSKFVGEKLNDMVNEYTEEWVILALGVAAENNIRKLSYVEGVLVGCKSEGRKPGDNKGRENKPVSSGNGNDKTPQRAPTLEELGYKVVR